MPSSLMWPLIIVIQTIQIICGLVLVVLLIINYIDVRRRWR